MRFHEAMEMLEKGNRVRCTKWPKDGFIVKNHHEIVDHQGSPADLLWATIDEDWEVLSQTNYDFSDALLLLNSGHAMRRASWPNDEWYIKMNEDGDILSIEEDNHIFNISDFTAKDWVLA